MLPIAPTRENESLRAMTGVLKDEGGFGEEDWVTWLANAEAEWVASGSPSRLFATVVEAALKAGTDDKSLGKQLATMYFKRHALVTAHPLYDHRHATALLSHSLLAAKLCSEERFSATMIAGVIRARDQRTPTSWQLVQGILQDLKLKPTITKEEMDDLVQQDEQADIVLFADASFAESARLVAEAGVAVHLDCDVEHELNRLFPLTADGGPTWTASGAHLAILYFCCAQCEFWDHSSGTLYEFEPRGGGAPEVIFSRFRETGVYAATANPVLNNAKSAAAIDRAWASSKKGSEAGSAHALATLLEHLDALAFTPRRHMAAYIRAWLARLLRANQAEVLDLPVLSDSEAMRLARGIAKTPTATRGVLEQRLVDALVLNRFHSTAVAVRGAGDAVNANNLSRGKLGDIEVELADRSIMAFEPHGGVLKQLYVDQHHRSLQHILRSRLDQLDRSKATRGDWNVKVTFVSFGSVFEVRGPREVIRSESGTSAANLVYVFTTFEDLLDDALESSDEASIARSINSHVVKLLSPAYVPRFIKERLLKLARAAEA